MVTAAAAEAPIVIPAAPIPSRRRNSRRLALGVATDFSAIVQSESYAGAIRTDAPLLNVVQFLLVLAAMLVAVVLLPTSG
ncbi:hypothetical protein [uncultured Microbacterium sp.]|uniref:hypothetical protein n=1 Tax=uncultured Microbacterium sp. TaxID=191216 RepID=UPI0026089E86|nr:hypothetical protein [uncultured Microbacterium sp.]